MKKKAEILTNIVLILCVAFSVYVSIETNKKMQEVEIMFELIELRDSIYNETRMKILKDLEESIKEAEKTIKLEQDRLNTL